MLRWRFATAVILAPAVLGAILLGRWTVLPLVLIVSALAAYELSRALDPLPFPAALGVVILPVLLAVPWGPTGAVAGVMLSLPWILVWLAFCPDLRDLKALAALLLGTVWIGAALAHVTLLMELPDGRLPVLVAVVGPWISDSGGYFAGRLFGRHQLFPSLSPNKTVEGGIGALLLTVLIIGGVAYVFFDMSALQALMFSTVVGVMSQAGDLFESLLKRILDLKDLGRVLPGHGGMLDRIDSLLFTAPAVYYMLLLI